MTEEEIARFALVLKECERIRPMMAHEEAILSSGGIPIAATERVEEEVPVPAMVAAA